MVQYHSLGSLRLLLLKISCLVVSAALKADSVPPPATRRNSPPGPPRSRSAAQPPGPGSRKNAATLPATDIPTFPPPESLPPTVAAPTPQKAVSQAAEPPDPARPPVEVSPMSNVRAASPPPPSRRSRKK